MLGFSGFSVLGFELHEEEDHMILNTNGRIN